MKSYIFSLIFLIFASGCAKTGQENPTSVQKHQDIKTLAAVPSHFSQGDAVQQALPTHIISRKENATFDRDILQLVFGLRDAVQNKAHSIQSLAQGSLFMAHKTPTELFITSSYNNSRQNSLQKYSLKGSLHGSLIVFTLHESSPNEDSLPRTSISIKPCTPGDIFDSETLTAVQTTLESTYASNETALVIDCEGKTSTLCRRGASSQIFLHLQKNEILADIVALAISPEDFLITLAGMPRAQNLPAVALKKEDPAMKKVLLVLMPKDFQELEFQTTYNTLIKKGLTVDIAGLSSGDCTGSDGLCVTPDKMLFQMTAEDLATYDSLIITGGFGSTEFLWGNKDLHEVVRYFHAAKKLVAAICYASIVPVETGLLTDKEATVYPTDVAKAILTKHGVIFKDAPYVFLKDENIITGQGPTYAQDFADAIVENLTHTAYLNVESTHND